MRRFVLLLSLILLSPATTHAAPSQPSRLAPAHASGGPGVLTFDPIGCVVCCYACSPIFGPGDPDCCLWCDNNCVTGVSFNTNLAVTLRRVSPWVEAVAAGVEAGQSFHEAITHDPRPSFPGHDWFGHWNETDKTVCVENIGTVRDTAMLLVLLNHTLLNLPEEQVVLDMPPGGVACVNLGPIVPAPADLDFFIFSVGGPAQSGDGVYSFNTHGNVGVTPTIPTEFNLRVSPNPARAALISLSLPRAGRVELGIFDVSGRRVRTLIASSYTAGAHTIPWDGTDLSGSRLRSGMYFVHLRTGDVHKTASVMLLR